MKYNFQKEASENWDGVKDEELFFSLCHPKGVAKSRKCIKCGIMFPSSDAGRRYCIKCKSTRSTRGAKDIFIRGENWN